MSGTWTWYGQGLLNWANGGIDFDTDSFKIMLTTSSYTPTQDSDNDRDDVSNEVGASGTYAAGGGSTTVSTSYDGASNELRITCTDVSFTSATITARTAVLYKDSGASATDLLVAYCTESGDVTSTAGTFTVDNPSPTLTVTAS